jgi:hypothetical protein
LRQSPVITLPADDAVEKLPPHQSKAA